MAYHSFRAASPLNRAVGNENRRRLSAAPGRLSPTMANGRFSTPCGRTRPAAIG